MKQIYLDNAATTPVDPEVFLAMKPYFTKIYGNASEVHSLGQQAKLAIEKSRAQIADFLGCNPQEIIFTSSATESINLSHKGLIEGMLMGWKGSQKPHIITCGVEHMAVLETCKHLELLDLADITFVPVDQYGLVKVEDIQKAIRPATILVSIMYVNNEVGTVEPIRQIGQMLKKENHRIYFHTDATQAVQYLNCDVKFLGVDFLSFTGHKFGAPKGIGALYARKGSTFVRQQDGGGQEGRMRAGTENVPYIVGLGKAVKMSAGLRVKNAELMKKLRDRLIAGVLKIPEVKLTGHPKLRAPHIASFVIEGAEGESIILLLSNEGIFASSGSACTSDKLAPSHVLSAMGIPPEISHGSLRFSLGKNTTKEDVDYVIKILPKVIKRLRIMAPKGIYE
ncbi:cysteine desulfurase [Candidatus Daviesbacteria bacterium]|nr:cysteine desulfurase [Candidatus Daviesbacteria bacterium]